MVFVKGTREIARKLISQWSYGWQPDPPDPRDVKLSSTSLNSLSGVVRDEMDNSALFRPVSNQQAYPSCSANATADAWEGAEIVQRVDGGAAIQEAVAATADLSRMFVWFNARQLMDPPKGYDATSGTYNRLSMDVVHRHGICTESSFPYLAANAAVRPPIRCYREAFYHRSAGFFAIPEEGSRRHDLVLQTLANQHSVVFGTALGEAFRTYKGGVLQVPSKTVARHAMVICGWSKSRNAYKVRNSHGLGFGEAGHCWMSREYIDDYDGTKSLWVPTYLPLH
jgi:C1A family cysteine protease